MVEFFKQFGQANYLGVCNNFNWNRGNRGSSHNPQMVYWPILREVLLTKAFKKDICPFCYRYTTVSRHHVFGVTKAMRRFSERYKAIIWPCWGCHVTDSDSIHRNAELRRELKAEHQKRIMQEQNWDLKRWIEEVGEDYLDENI